MTTDPKKGYVDALALEYIGLQAAAAKAKEAAETFRHGEVEPVLLKWGVPHAKKSTIVRGDEFEIVRSVGDSVEVDQVAVAKLYATLCQARCYRVFRKLFKLVCKYDIADTANAIIYARELPERAPRNLRQLFCEAVHVEKKAPTITARPIETAGK